MHTCPQINYGSYLPSRVIPHEIVRTYFLYEVRTRKRITYSCIDMRYTVYTCTLEFDYAYRCSSFHLHEEYTRFYNGIRILHSCLGNYVRNDEHYLRTH